MTAATDEHATDTVHDCHGSCVVCGATTGIKRLNDLPPALRTPSLAPDYFACVDGGACIDRALKAAAGLVLPEADQADEPVEDDTEQADETTDTGDEPDEDAPGD